MRFPASAGNHSYAKGVRHPATGGVAALAQSGAQIVRNSNDCIETKLTVSRDANAEADNGTAARAKKCPHEAGIAEDDTVTKVLRRL